MKKCFFLMAVIIILLFGLSLTMVLAADEEALGQQAEEAGKLREALTHYVVALQKTSEGSAADQRLKERIIKLVQKIQPPPAIPEEARRFSARGRAAMEEAKSISDFAEAAKELSKALRLAPWWAESYFNLGLALEKAGELDGAVRNLKLYLLASPGASDADKVKDRIYAIEYRQEKARKEAQEKAEEARRQEAARIERERREVEERAAPSLPTTGQYWSSCLGAPGTGVTPSNPIQIEVKNSQEFWHRVYDGAFREWDKTWIVFQYDSSTRSFINRIYIINNRPVSGKGDIRIKVISSDYLVWEYADGRKCELRRQR